MVEKILIGTNKILKQKVTFQVKMTTFEKVTAAIIFMAIVLLMFVTVYTKTRVDSVNQSIESLRLETKKIDYDNQLLQQKIDQLATMERVEKVATAYGLSRNVTNVQSVSKK